MPSLTIKNVPKELYEKLKETARHHRRSMNSEIIVRLERSLQHVSPDEEDLADRIRTLREKFPGHLTDADLRHSRDEGRP